jgi:hypothetical protein
VCVRVCVCVRAGSHTLCTSLTALNPPPVSNSSEQFEPEAPSGPLAGDDDFQALHGAVRLLARAHGALQREHSALQAAFERANEQLRVQQTEITSLQRSFESFKVTTLGLHEDLTRELALTAKLVNARHHGAGSAGPAFADIDLGSATAGTASLGTAGASHAASASVSGAVNAGSANANAGASANAAGGGDGDLADGLNDTNRLRPAAWASSVAAYGDSDSESDDERDTPRAASSSGGAAAAAAADKKSKRLKSPKGRSAADAAGATGDSAREVAVSVSAGGGGVNDNDDDDEAMTPRGTKKKVKTPRRKKSEAAAAAAAAAAAPVVNVGGYRVESGSDAATAPFGKDATLQFPDKYTPVFKTNYLPFKHKNFVQGGAGDPLVVTCSRKPGFDDELSVILFTHESTAQLSIKTKKWPNAKELGQLLKAEWAPAQRGRDVSRLKQVKSTEMTKLLASFEDMNLENKFKVSVVYMSEGQTTAAEMLSNIGSSLEFQKFLQLLGESVKLEGFAGFSGDLDTVEGNTGKQSVFTVWRGLEIMYHVATLLPYDPQDPQQLTKRKYLESNTAMIVFKDGPPALNPRELITDVTCVVIVVELIETATLTSPVAKYRIAVVVKDGVAPFGPDMPRSGEFKHGEQMRDFILAKLINGVQASMELPRFREPFQQARAALLRELSRKS